MTNISATKVIGPVGMIVSLCFFKYILASHSQGQVEVDQFEISSITLEREVTRLGEGPLQSRKRNSMFCCIFLLKST